MRRPTRKLLKLGVVTLALIIAGKVYVDVMWPRNLYEARFMEIGIQGERRNGAVIANISNKERQSPEIHIEFVETNDGQQRAFPDTKPDSPATNITQELDETALIDLLLKYNFLSNKSPNQTDVHLLVSSYTRSGSTFTAGLLASPTTFYVNEPLAYMIPWSYLDNNGSLCDQRDMSCQPAKHSNVDPAISTIKSFARSDEYPVDTARRALRNIYFCSFDSGFEALLRRGVKSSSTTSDDTLKEYYDCVKGSSDSIINQSCLDGLAKKCQSKTTRMTKVVRLSLGILQPLLREDPKLKVIHLFRDPHSILASRLHKSVWYSIGNNTPYRVRDNAGSLCTKMVMDYTTGLRLLQEFPDRFVMLRYEDLSGPFSTQISKSVLNFAHLPNTTDFSVIKTLNDVFLNYWSKHMNVDIFKDINSVCEEAIKTLGYSLLHNLPKM